MMLELFTKHLIKLVCTICLAHTVYGQAPGNLTADVDLTSPGETDFAPYAFFSSTAQVTAAFNKGRRTEETQLGLVPNSLGNLVLPATYASISVSQRALFLINSERQARAGINYGTGPVLGKPLQAVENNLSSTAQNHAAYLFSSNTFGHTGSGNSTPKQRIEATYPTNCLQRNGAGQYTMGRTENIYNACGGNSTYVIEQAIFTWLYQDKSSSWGHREAVLIQSVDASGYTGFVDDRGAVGNEGFLGIGLQTGTGYSPCGSLPAKIVVMNIADPSSDATCNFSLEQDPLPVSLLFWRGTFGQRVATLEWATNWEQKASYFELQRSTDLHVFDRLGIVQANGTTTEKQAYSFVDESPLNGYNYYRLVQVDIDGKQEISRIIALLNPTECVNQKLVLSPNPIRSSEAVSIRIDDKLQTDIHAYTITGQEVPVQSWRVGGQVLVKPLTTWPSGLLIIKNTCSGTLQPSTLLVTD